MVFKAFAIIAGVLLCAHAALFAIPARAADRDAIERQTGLVKVEHERFILDLKYDSRDNFLNKNVYADFDLHSCYVRSEVHDRLMAVVPPLKRAGYRLVLFDCFRPLAVQEAMWKIVPDSRYVANPKTGSLHNRGTAIDVGLATKEGVYLDFPTGFDSFEPKAAQGYVCAKTEQHLCANRARLRHVMEAAGFVPSNSEWWHFHLVGARRYPLINLKD